MGYIIVHVVHVVSPKRLVHCTPTLTGNGQSHALLPYGELFLVSQARQRRPPNI